MRVDGDGRVAADCRAQLPERQLLREQLLECEASLRRMTAGREHVELRIRRRAMYVPQRLVQAGKSQLAHDFPRQEVGQPVVAHCRERLRGEVPQASLLHAFGDRIDRRQDVLDRLLVGRVGVLVFRVHDLRSVLAAANLAETAQARTAHQLLLLRAAEVKEAQRQEAGAVGKPHEQRAPAAEHDLGKLDRALDRRANAGTQRSDRHEVRAVLVARRQPEEQVGDGLDAEPREPPGERRPDALQRRDRAALERHRRRPRVTARGCSRPRSPRRAAAQPLRSSRALGKAR